MPSVTALELGKAGEHLVAADLILQGWPAHLASQGSPYDVLVDVGGRLLKVQVKTTAAPRIRVSRLDLNILGYHFHVKRCGKGGAHQYEKGAIDLMALVAMDIRKIAYITPWEVKQSIVLRPPGYPMSNAISRKEDIGQLPFSRVLEMIK